MKKLLFAGVSVVALWHGGWAQAQTVFCANCSELVWDKAHEIWEGVQFAQQLEQQIATVKYTILGWEEAIRTNLQLPFRIFNDITGGVREIQGIAQEASLIGEHTKFMIDHLGDPSGFGGSLEDIPRALAQENNAMAWAMQQFGVSAQRSQDLASDYSAKLAELQAQDVSSPTQAAQVTAQIAATRGQMEAAQYAANNAAWQAMATAELRRTHKEVMLEAKVAENQQAAIEASCGSMTVITPAICAGVGGGGGVQVAAAQ